jgi:hypothetical protein
MRPLAWSAALVSASGAVSLGLACAMPFAAVAAIAALTSSRRDAFRVVGLAWLANQAVGFGVLHYPWTADTFAWGIALLAASLLAVHGAGICTARTAALPRLAHATLAFLSAFLVYEGLLCLVALATGSGTAAFSPDVIARLFVLNATAFVLLAAARSLRLPQWRRLQAPSRSAA